MEKQHNHIKGKQADLVIKFNLGVPCSIRVELITLQNQDV